MTISPSVSWIWPNGHCRSIRNGPNSREPVWLCRNRVRKWVNRSKYRFWASGGSLGLNREYSAEYSIGSAAARRAARLGKGIFSGIFVGSAGGSARGDRLVGSARREYGARVKHSSSTSGRVVCAWSNSAESSGGACGLPPSPIKLIFAPVSSYGWALHGGMIKTCFGQLWKFGYLPKHFCFSDERGSDTNLLVGETTGGGSDTNCWWEKPLVVALKHSEGIKHKVLFQEQKLTNTKSLQYTPSLFSLVFLSNLSHTK